jgi:chromosome segregation ATPase
VQSHSKALETQQAEIQQMFNSMLEDLQADLTTLEEEKQEAVLEKKFALDELETLKKELHAEIDALRSELGAKSDVGSTTLSEITQKYEALLAENASAENDHQSAILLMKMDLKEQHELAVKELQTKHDAVQERLAQIDQEHGDAVELLKEEFREGHSNDVQSLKQQLEAMQKQHKELSEQKATMDQAHEEAISELMLGMESSQSDAVQQLQRKYDALVANLEAAHASHAAELESIKQGDTEQQTFHKDLQTRHDKAVAEANKHAEEVSRLRETIDTMRTEQDAVRRTAIPSDVEAQELERLKEALATVEAQRENIEAERDQALEAVQDAEDRIETMKVEVVKKHLARVEPLEKENADLSDRIDRLEAIIAAGDRITRAAVLVGEKREINTLTEEDEDEEEQGSSEDAASGAQEAPKVNGVDKDVIGTVSLSPYVIFRFVLSQVTFADTL